MLISLQAKATPPTNSLTLTSVPLSVTIRPANYAQGSFEYETDSADFLALLRRKTDLSEGALRLFARDLKFNAASRIPAVTFDDDLLREIGFYID